MITVWDIAVAWLGVGVLVVVWDWWELRQRDSVRDHHAH